jgi:hypothetical protein
MNRTRLLSLLGLWVAGCGGDTKADSGGHGHDDGSHAHEETCGEPGETFTAGMSKDGPAGAVGFALTSAVPAPPDKGDNLWTVTLTDSNGDAITDATLTVEPWMPEHEHGSSPESFSAQSNGEGAYETEAINLFMGGLWELTLIAALGDGTVDQVTFTFCIEG